MGGVEGQRLAESCCWWLHLRESGVDLRFWRNEHLNDVIKYYIRHSNLVQKPQQKLQLSLKMTISKTLHISLLDSFFVNTLNSKKFHTVMSKKLHTLKGHFSVPSPKDKYQSGASEKTFSGNWLQDLTWLNQLSRELLYTIKIHMKVYVVSMN